MTHTTKTKERQKIWIASGHRWNLRRAKVAAILKQKATTVLPFEGEVVKIDDFGFGVVKFKRSVLGHTHGVVSVKTSNMTSVTGSKLLSSAVKGRVEVTTGRDFGKIIEIALQ